MIPKILFDASREEIRNQILYYDDDEFYEPTAPELENFFDVQSISSGSSVRTLASSSTETSSGEYEESPKPVRYNTVSIPTIAEEVVRYQVSS